MRSHLLNDTTTEHYRRSVTEGVERVAAKLAATDRPFTGVTVDDLAPRIDAIDLDQPLRDTTAVLDELEDVYLRDAVYFHHPRYLAHLNCPVVIPAVLGEAVLSAVNSSLDTWDQSARRHPDRAETDRLDGRPHRPRPGRRRRVHLGRHPVQPPGAAARPRGDQDPGPGETARPRLRGQPLQRAEVREAARPRP